MPINRASHYAAHPDTGEAVADEYDVEVLLGQNRKITDYHYELLEKIPLSVPVWKDLKNMHVDRLYERLTSRSFVGNAKEQVVLSSRICGVGPAGELTG